MHKREERERKLEKIDRKRKRKRTFAVARLCSRNKSFSRFSHWPSYPVHLTALFASLLRHTLHPNFHTAALPLLPTLRSGAPASTRAATEPLSTPLCLVIVHRHIVTDAVTIVRASSLSSCRRRRHATTVYPYPHSTYRCTDARPMSFCCHKCAFSDSLVTSLFSFFTFLPSLYFLYVYIFSIVLFLRILTMYTKMY